MNSFTSLSLILISLGLGFFVAKPMFAEISNLSSKKSEYKVALESMHSIEELKQNLIQKLENLSPETKEKIEALLPASPNTVKLISDIDSIASNHGITVDNFTYTAPNKDTRQSVAEALPAKPYSSTMVNFNFTSDYAKFRSFLRDLESSLRIADIRTISIEAGDNGLNVYKMGAEIYWLP